MIVISETGFGCRKSSKQAVRSKQEPQLLHPNYSVFANILLFMHLCKKNLARIISSCLYGFYVQSAVLGKRTSMQDIIWL
jgi:hypothetical protein